MGRVSTAPQAPLPRTASPSPHAARGFWVVAYVFATTLAFSGAPAPLYVLYQREQGFGPLAVTVVFGAYAVGVALSLYLAGHLSDRFGRRRVTAPAVVLNVLAALVFLASHELLWLLVARFTSGLGVGMLTATATAHLTELHRSARPHASPALATAVGAAANLGGIGLGPLVAGLLAERTADPLSSTYLVFAVLMALGLLGLVTVPETVAPATGPWSYRPQRVAVPPHARAGFRAAGAVAFTGFALFGFFTSLAPSFLSGTLHEGSHAVAGAVTALVFGSAATAQALTGSWGSARLYRAGLGLLPGGVVLVVAAILTPSFPLLLAGGLVVGAGAGLAFRGAVAAVVGLAEPGGRGESLAGLFLIAYLGLAAPVVLLGALVRFAPLGPSITGFGAVVLALLALSAALVRSARPAAG
ncbi:MFS transporter [Actinosynnema pretiosum subsp. pretiosum]|uniref:MFS transporter n=1 Tax=Actinosynnema pretiosum subsp. pretiosum TaxID=103721 RepID=A0AA45L8J2_9PSEU|nr:MFS transporter [Actinosynnema pretiosum subsp. pretiosum]